MVSGDIARALRVLRSEPHVQLRDMFDDAVQLGGGRRPVGPRGLAQKRYVEAIRSHDLTFGIGPAGTGKTYLAMACAVSALTERKVKRIVLTRPAVEAGEKLGFLPGDLAEKVNPYLRPLYDALNDMMDLDRAQGLIRRGHIEVAPLAFMRGRTLNDSFVILDEAQNTTSEQMRMFLTRLGHNAKAVVTGDVTQVDLPAGRASGLAEAAPPPRGRLRDRTFCHFSEVDVVRHPLVQKIVVRYEALRDKGRIAAPGPMTAGRSVKRRFRSTASSIEHPERARRSTASSTSSTATRVSAGDAICERPHPLLVVVWRQISASGPRRATERLSVVSLLRPPCGIA